MPNLIGGFDIFENVIGTLKFLVENPGIAVFAVVFALFLYWLQSRMFRRILTKQAELDRSGWTTAAKTATRRHDTGVGTQKVLVMRPERGHLSVAIWGFFLFGGGVLVSWFLILPDPDEPIMKKVFVFGFFCVATMGSILLFVRAFTRIRVSSQDIIRHRVFRRPERFALSEISKAEQAAKNPAMGVKLSFPDGRTLKLMASYEGYAQVLNSIQTAHPDLPRLLMLGRMVDSAIARKKAAANAK